MIGITSGQFLGQEITVKISGAELNRLGNKDSYDGFEKAWDSIKDWFCNTHKVEAKEALLTLYRADAQYFAIKSDYVDYYTDSGYTSHTHELTKNEVKTAFETLQQLAGARNGLFSITQDEENNLQRYEIKNENGDRSCSFRFFI
ncbi:hypothetical protein [Shewanella surugensis]|uniref:Uncharacterized protein n=1 Tax=Shewanella surugensis TaxID=212020 RepID=A0ABT0LAJ7_9GAMM|nr:hypothetical protein [Shewanella surugensis]MCL1124670.1 hypothetical protein [Shewanella surugensis]